MIEITLTTPTLLFSAISLIMLAYTNRFIAYAALVRTLSKEYQENKDSVVLSQIKNLRKRLKLTRSMQIFGISSLLLCVLTMFLIYIQVYIISLYVFGIALTLLIVSLSLLVWEIQISHKSLEYHLDNISDELNK